MLFNVDAINRLKTETATEYYFVFNFLNLIAVKTFLV